MYKTSGRMSRELIEKNYFFVYSPRLVNVLFCIMIAYLLSLVVRLFIAGEIASGIFYLIVTGGVIAVDLIVPPLTFGGVNEKRFIELYNSKTPEYTVSFDGEDVCLEAGEEKKTTVIKLYNFKKLILRNDMYFLRTESGIVFPIFACQLTESEREALISELRNKGIKITKTN